MEGGKNPIKSESFSRPPKASKKSSCRLPWDWKRAGTRYGFIKSNMKTISLIMKQLTANVYDRSYEAKFAVSRRIFVTGKKDFGTHVENFLYVVERKIKFIFWRFSQKKNYYRKFTQEMKIALDTASSSISWWVEMGSAVSFTWQRGL